MDRVGGSRRSILIGQFNVEHSWCVVTIFLLFILSVYCLAGLTTNGELLT